MKSWVCLCVVLCSCQKIDDTAARREDRAAIVASYRADLDALDARMQALVKRGLKLDRPLPGSDAAGAMVNDASNHLRALHQRITELGGNLTPTKAAEDLEELDKDTIAITGELSTAESWVARAEVQMAQLGSAAPHG